MISRNPRRLLLVFAFVVVSPAGCSAWSDPPLDYAGTPGQPTAIRLLVDTPVAQVTVDGAPEEGFLIDTGSPATILDADAFGLPAGLHTPGSIDVLGISVLGREVPVVDLFDDQVPIQGILGGDVLKFFTLTLDYAGELAVLTDEPGAPPPDIGADVAVPITAAFELKGGGILAIDSDDDYRVGKTRVTLDLTVEGRPLRAVVDSGASTLVLADDLWTDLLAARPERPRLGGLEVVTVDGVRDAMLTRVGSIDVAGAALTSVPAMVVPGSAALTYLSDEVGQRVDLLIGGSYLRAFQVTIDYPDRRLHLERYHDPSHIDPEEWVTIGFTVSEPSPGVVVVETIFPEHDPEAQGVAPGYRILEAAGFDVTTEGYTALESALAGTQPGDRVNMIFDTGPTQRDLDILVEDLLPHFD